MARVLVCFVIESMVLVIVQYLVVQSAGECVQSAVRFLCVHVICGCKTVLTGCGMLFKIQKFKTCTLGA